MWVRLGANFTVLQRNLCAVHLILIFAAVKEQKTNKGSVGHYLSAFLLFFSVLSTQPGHGPGASHVRPSINHSPDTPPCDSCLIFSAFFITAKLKYPKSSAALLSIESAGIFVGCFAVIAGILGVLAWRISESGYKGCLIKFLKGKKTHHHLLSAIANCLTKKPKRPPCAYCP